MRSTKKLYRVSQKKVSPFAGPFFKTGNVLNSKLFFKQRPKGKLRFRDTMQSFWTMFNWCKIEFNFALISQLSIRRPFCLHLAGPRFDKNV